MKTVLFPYGKDNIRYDFKDEELAGVLTSSIEEHTPAAGECDLVRSARESA